MSATRPPAFDDRFATPIEASRRGAHRERPKPMSAGLPVVAGIAVVLLVVGGVYTMLHGGGSDVNPSSNVAAAPTLTNPAATGGAATGGAATSAPAAAATADPAATTATGAGVDRSVDLVVLNSVSVQGLAKKVKASLEQSGWTVQRTDNSVNKNLPTSKVYYGKSALKSTATALVTDLGYGEVVRDATVAKTGLVVVLGQDATNT
jgi:hypothetical protein